MGALQDPCSARTMSSLCGRRQRALIGVIADDRWWEFGDIILLGPLRLVGAWLAYLGDVHAVIRCGFIFATYWL